MISGRIPIFLNEKRGGEVRRNNDLTAFLRTKKMDVARTLFELS